MRRWTLVRGRGRWQLAALVVATTCGAAFMAGAPAAAGPPRLRVLVRVASTADLALATRVRGHASDLPVDFTEVPGAELEPALPERLSAAEVLGRQLRADVVLWFDRRHASVFVMRPAPGYFLEVARTGDREVSPRSAELEGTAVRLRRVLKTIAEGGIVGQRRDSAIPAAAPALVSAAPARVQEGGVQEGGVEEGGLRVLFAAGGEQLFDGLTSTTGASARAGIGVGRIELSGFAQLFRERRGEATFYDVTLSRRAFGVEAAYGAIRAERVHLLGIAALLLAQADKTFADEQRTRDADRYDRPVASAGLRVRFPFWRPSPTVGVAFWASAILDAMWRPPRFENDARLGGELGWLQPRIGLGCEVSGG